MKACYRNPVFFQECALKGRPAPGSTPEMGGWTQVSSTLAAVVGHQEGGAHSKVKRQIVLSANYHHQNFLQISKTYQFFPLSAFFVVPP